MGRNADKNEEGSFVWKLRDELSAALDKADLSNVKLYVAAASGEKYPVTVAAPINAYTKE